VARYRLSEAASSDIASILRASEASHGGEARVRYRALLTAALRRIASDPTGLSTVDRGDLRSGVRSLHIRHCRLASREAPVANPVHVVFYRALEPSVIEIVRILHERMDIQSHIGA
jgi:toxin ParE1/3/4